MQFKLENETNLYNFNYASQIDNFKKWNIKSTKILLLINNNK